MRMCRKCHESFPATEQYFNRAAGGGLAKVCRTCDCRGGKGRGRAVTPVQPETEGAKFCPTCRRWFMPTAENFGPDKTKRTGLSSLCRECQRDARRTSYRKHHGEQLRRNLDPDRKFRGYRGGARYRNIEWELSRDEFMELWGRPCTYCGSAIETIGIDRTDSAEGYTISNTVPCCITCNRMKSDLSSDDFVAHLRIILAHVDGDEQPKSSQTTWTGPRQLCFALGGPPPCAGG